MVEYLAFCEECRADVEYDVTEVPMSGMLMGFAYHYLGKEARCAKCGAVVYVPEICDYNLKALYNVYYLSN